MNAARIAAAGLALLACAAQADVDLVGAWQAAAGADPTFAAAGAQRDAGTARGRQGRALWLPNVAFGASQGYRQTAQESKGVHFEAPGFGKSNGVSFQTDLDGHGSAWRISAEQPIFDAAVASNARELGFESELAAVKYTAAGQDLMLKTARAYFAVLAAEDAIAELEKVKAATSRALEIARESFAAGRIPITDQNEAEARFDEITASEVAARNALEVKRAEFADVTGLTADGLARPDTERTLAGFDGGPLDAWQSRAAAASPLIAMQRLAGSIATEEIRKYTALRSPSLALVAQVGAEDLDGDTRFGTSGHMSSDSGAIGLELKIPLFTGGMRSAKHDEAAARAAEAGYTAEAIRREVLTRTRAAWLGATSGNAQVAARRQALVSSRSRLDATRTGHEVGARTMLELLQAEADCHRAERELLVQTYQALLDRLSLAAAAGSLSEAELGAVNGTLRARAAK
ncbi:MAG: TolC family outer membrane protein [Gammaproteobacteria bacterium]|nr:TolC family outer membrane protein [Gammaproteobacteria bacterium]MBI5615951.1 TolC family outer membrane protein [Gammaproteobacteria bacterium]